MGQKPAAEFYSAFYFADETMSGTHVAQTAVISADCQTKWWIL